MSGPPWSALLLDAAGTLLSPARSVAETYAAFARAHGVEVTAAEVRSRFAASMKRAAPLRREAPDWRPFWREVVHACTGSDDPRLLDDLIGHFCRAQAWTLAPGALACIERVRAAGIALGLVSNWDHNLRPLLRELELERCFDALVISAEVGLEKPDPRIFALACTQLGVAPHATVHVGDDETADLAGARSAGCGALLFGRDVADFEALARLVAQPGLQK